MNVLSLFAGIGGIDLAARWAGMQTIAFCEIDKFCQQVLRKHWPDVPIYDDVRTITKKQLEKDGVINDTRTIDMVCGGFPCQPFSVAGKQRGQADDRHLWPEMLRVIKELRPAWVLGENVTGLIRLGLDDVITDLENEGYTVRAFVLPASAVQAPHQRQRVFIVAHTTSSQCKPGAEESTTLSKVHEDGGKYDNTGGSGETCEAVAYTSSKRRDNGGNNWKERQIHSNQKRDTSKNKQEGDEWLSRVSANGEVMVNAASLGQSGQGELVQSIDTKANQGGETGEFVHVCINQKRTVKPRLGGKLNGSTTGVDGHKWPAFLGQEQFDWEPPRVATGVKHRKERLKALGNAVVPQQIYPILKAIMEVSK